MGATPSHENDGDDVAGTDSDDDDDIIKMQPPPVRYRVSKFIVHFHQRKKIKYAKLLFEKRRIGDGQRTEGAISYK